MCLPTCVMLLPYLWSTLTKTRSGNERVQMAMARDCEFETKGGPRIPQFPHFRSALCDVTLPALFLSSMLRCVGRIVWRTLEFGDLEGCVNLTNASRVRWFIQSLIDDVDRQLQAEKYLWELLFLPIYFMCTALLQLQ